jgi:glycosyltransferase involved in cell wall biosynthesis
VLTSVVEGFPLTIMEAALCGVPSIGADTLGINEEIEDGRTGLLFAQDDPLACAAAILRLLGEDGLRDELGRNAKAAARAYSAGRTADLFAELVAKHIPR